MYSKSVRGSYLTRFTEQAECGVNCLASWRCPTGAGIFQEGFNPLTPPRPRHWLHFSPRVESPANVRGLCGRQCFGTAMATFSRNWCNIQNDRGFFRIKREFGHLIGLFISPRKDAYRARALSKRHVSFASSLAKHPKLTMM